VFSLVGKARNTGLVELPLGTTLDHIVYGMGGGAGQRKRIRAVQTGGPSGGCVPAERFDSPVDYESLAELGAIMGSGGMVVMDADNCMVDVARYFVGFTAGESCGKCAPCREGLAQMLRILNAVSRGEAAESDLDELEAVAKVVRDSALCGLGQTAANPVLTTLRYFRDEYLAHIREKRCEAGVCESLFCALCENSCPLHLNIPGYLQLLKEGRIEDAFELTLRGNPLPGTIGRICHFHCQMRCRRETLDEPVSQGEIHRYLADTVYKLGREKAVYAKLVAEKLPPTGKRIAVVGAGPAGIAASFFLARLGHEVTLYDEHEKPGGILRYGIPAYRLPREVLDKETGILKRLGVRFAGGMQIGKAVSIVGLAAENDAVLLAVGAGADKPLGIPGEDLPGCVPGYAFLEAFNEKRARVPGAKVLVIGGGNVAVDAARTLLRAGSSVTIAYRRTRDDLPANPKEIEGAEEEGIEFRYMLQPQEVLAGSDGRARAVRFAKMDAGPIDSSGRPTPVPTGETVVIECDAVVSAVGERVDSAALGIQNLATGVGGTIVADRFRSSTSQPKFYATGDAVSGPATAAQAMGLAKKTAFAIDRVLTGLDRSASLDTVFTYKMAAVLEPEGGRQNRAPRLGPGERRNNFHEVELGYSGEQALAEAARCLRCDVRT
jgi:NADH-quinone oxidoreductase subunit F